MRRMNCSVSAVGVLTVLIAACPAGAQIDGRIVAWGLNLSGQGNFPSPSGFIAIAAGGTHSLGLTAEGSIVGVGQYGGSGGAVITYPNSGFIAIAAGSWHSLGLLSDGSIMTWGCRWPQNEGQCTVPSPNSGFTAIAAGALHSLGLKANGSIVGWGDNWGGQLNVPSPNSVVVQPEWESRRV